ncbi:MAG: hypothetical protein AAFY71_22770 [Bacteroidota bacterium]
MMGTRNRKFYLYWSISFLVVVAVAFAPKYWLLIFSEGVTISNEIHWHAFFATAWIVIYAIQTLFIHKKLIRPHQILGYMSILFTIGVIVSGFYVSLGLVERALASNSAGARPLLLVNLLDLALFGSCYTLGIKNRRDGITHKRLLTLAAILLLNAAFFRIGRFMIGPGFLAVLLAIVLTSGVIILYLWSEKKHSQQPNKRLWRLAIGVIIIHIIRIPLAITPIWANIADVIMKNFG